MLLAFLSSLPHIIYMALHHVSASSFPKPLSAEEERRCLTAFRERGDMTARSKLIEHNLRLVAHIIKKYYSTDREQDDFISIGTIGLIKAVDTFDHQKGIRLATYAARCIENEILMVFRAWKKTDKDVSYFEPIETDKDGNPLSLIDVIAGEDTIVEDLAAKIDAERLANYIQESLTPREREIIERRYGLVGDGLTQREVAASMDISRSYVSRIEKKALEKLRHRFEGTRGG